MVNRFLPMVLGTVIVAIIITIAAQMVTSHIVAAQGLTLPSLPGWPVWVAVAVSTSVLLWLVASSIRRAINAR